MIERQQDRSVTPTAPTSETVLLLTTRQAAKALAISSRLLWTLTACGELPCVRIGRAVRYSLADLETWISVHKRGRPENRKAMKP